MTPDEMIFKLGFEKESEHDCEATYRKKYDAFVHSVTIEWYGGDVEVLSCGLPLDDEEPFEYVGLNIDEMLAFLSKMKEIKSNL